MPITELDVQIMVIPRPRPRPRPYQPTGSGLQMTGNRGPLAFGPPPPSVMGSPVRA